MDSSVGTARQQRSDSNSSAASVGERRRSSGLFASLEQQKRSTNPEQIARRASMHDHKPAAGVFGRMWNNYVHGTNN